MSTWCIWCGASTALGIYEGRVRTSGDAAGGVGRPRGAQIGRWCSSFTGWK